MFASFMINTWIVATEVAVIAGIVGFFVVIRGASFAAHALPLGAFPGAAAATLLGIDRMFGLIAFAALGAFGIFRLSRDGRHDVATALWLVMLLGLGALFLSLTNQYSQTVYALLFGEVLGVSRGDVVSVSAVGAISICAICMLFRPLLLNAVSAELGEAAGVRGGRVELWFLGIVALATAAALPVVGALLVFSLMTGPAAAARLLTDRPVRAMGLSVVIAVITVWAAIVLSFLSDWPVGFFVGALGAAAYGAGRLARG